MAFTTRTPVPPPTPAPPDPSDIQNRSDSERRRRLSRGGRRSTLLTRMAETSGQAQSPTGTLTGVART